MYKIILVPLDGSARAEAILPHVDDLAHCYGAKVVFLQVVEPEPLIIGPDVVYPIVIDSRYTVDIDNLQDWARYEHLVMTGGLDYVSPGSPRRPMPEKIELLIMDFDGVLTDNRVWVNQDGVEAVAANRSDSYGLGLLRKAGVESLVISKETNPVVAARCNKMQVPFIQGIDDKETALRKVLVEKKIDAANVVFVGNDVNDLPGFRVAGWSVAVADALPEVIREADYVLSKPGGRGAVRELCDLILKSIQEKKNGS